MLRFLLFLLTSFLFVTSCTKKNDPAPSTTSLYFPPNSSTWESVTPASLGWNETAITDLITYLNSTNTRAFILLKDGKIVIEQYAGTQLTSGAFTASSLWYWASAGKTLTAAAVGIANANGKINLDAKTSDYLGAGWTSLTPTQENKITVRNQLTMTTGLDDYSGGTTGDADCTTPSCLIYKADAGTRWAYHNAAYTLLDQVIAAGTGKMLNDYITTEVLSKTGMDGSYMATGPYNNIFYSTPRSMARYGLLLLNKGVWNGTTIIPSSYFNLMIASSQNFNLSYGYLTWLNGKNSFMTPGSQAVYPQMLTPNAPADMFAAMGKNGQLINVVPSKNLVMIRMGDAPDNNLVPFTFQNELWGKLNAIITN
jgi:CubicO group peptidase (beta-lactamase class C family)